MKNIVSLTPTNELFNDLTNPSCTPKDYQFGINVCKCFMCRNLCEYTILYNHTDTLLLPEILRVNRKVFQDNFQIGINHFLGIPGLSFNLMLKIRKVKLEMISDPEMSDFFRKLISGEMSFIATRNAKLDYTDYDIENCSEKGSISDTGMKIICIEVKYCMIFLQKIMNLKIKPSSKKEKKIEKIIKN